MRNLKNPELFVIIVIMSALALSSQALAVTCDEALSVCKKRIKIICHQDYPLIESICLATAEKKCHAAYAEAKNTGTWPAIPEGNEPEHKCNR